MPDRVPLRRSKQEQRDEDEFLALYGSWAPLSPREVAAELDGFTRPWWLVGGRAVEATTGFQREHEDTDISVFASDVPALVAFLAGRWHVWNNVGGVLHPLGGRWPTVDEPASQLWLRRSASEPWVLDIPLTPDPDGVWTDKRDPAHTADLSEVTVVAEGIRCLRPEIVMSYKAALARPKDDADLRAVLPTLTTDRRTWLYDAIARQDPVHRWLAEVDPRRT